MLANGVDGHHAYESALRAAGPDATATADESLGEPVTVTMNASDGGYHLPHLCGSSTEAGDDGQVGRRNRFRGLITPGRSMSLEACAGKNPVAHPGKLYSVLSHRLARAIHGRCPELREVYVHLATRIGEPVDRPWAGVQVVLPPGARFDDFEARIADVVAAELAGMAAFRAGLLAAEEPVY